MNLEKRLSLLTFIGQYIKSNSPAFQEIKERAFAENKWFTPHFIDLAVNNIADSLLNEQNLALFAKKFNLENTPRSQKTVGIVMAGNIPLVGFHDLLCVFLSGHKQRIKLSTKDNILIPHLIEIIKDEFQEVNEYIQFSDMLKGCDVFIATGTNNSARYFEYYFGKHPHIIRKNRTSIAIIDGSESAEELDLLADDIQLYFGLGCRNITQVLVPENYDFVPLLNALKKYDYFREHDKYKNNFDYYLTIAIMNNQFYMTNNSILLKENESPFSPIGQLNYRYYKNIADTLNNINNNEIQTIVGKGFQQFGTAQKPGLEDFADGVNTMTFLQSL
jgi:hypothetical protein